MTADPARVELEVSRGSGIRRRLPSAAFAFVILALIALALAPSLLLERVSRAFDELTTTVLPTYERLGEVALTMERQSAAVRGRLLSDDPRYIDQLNAARADEDEALQQLEPLVRRVGPSAVEHLTVVQRISARRYSENARLMEADAGVETYRSALPQLELLRDSMLLHLAALEEELVRIAMERMERESRWAGFQRSLSFVLGAVAVLAALLVGWFARREHRLARELELALADANRLRTMSDLRREELERVTESRARLMRGFSHDVKNPLGAAGGYLDLMAEGLMGPLSEKQLRSVDRASRSIAAALNLVEDLLELARAETGNLEVALEPTDIRAVVEDAADEYRAQAEAKRLTLRVQIPDSVPPVMTDGKRVRQVLGNLISNAVKYTPEGGVTVRLEVPPSGDAGDPAGRLAIRVSDTGPGVAEHHQHLLFEEFVRLDPSAARGAGVGLTISHRIAQALGGAISVQSEVGEGSTFTFWLPLRHPRAEPTMNMSEAGSR